LKKKRGLGGSTEKRKIWWGKKGEVKLGVGRKPQWCGRGRKNVGKTLN